MLKWRTVQNLILPHSSSLPLSLSRSSWFVYLQVDTKLGSVCICCMNTVSSTNRWANGKVVLAAAALARVQEKAKVVLVVPVVSVTVMSLTTAQLSTPALSLCN